MFVPTIETCQSCVRAALRDGRIVDLLSLCASSTWNRWNRSFRRFLQKVGSIPVQRLTHHRRECVMHVHTLRSVKRYFSFTVVWCTSYDPTPWIHYLTTKYVLPLRGRCVDTLLMLWVCSMYAEVIPSNLSSGEAEQSQHYCTRKVNC